MTATVELAAVGNPDHGQDPSKPPWGVPKARDVQVSTLEEASKICRQYIADHDLGFGNWSGGTVKVGGEHVAYVSYGGKLFRSLETLEEIKGEELTRRLNDDGA
jgi:hypothetical protein